MTTPQWAITDNGNQHVVDIPNPTRRPTTPQPATVTPGTDKKPTSLIEEEAKDSMLELAATGRIPQGEGRAYIVGYQAGYTAAWQASAAHYHLGEDGTYTGRRP